MSYNSAFDPSSGRDPREQQKIDQQYARQVANNQQAGVYNQPGVYSQPVTTTSVTSTDVVVPKDKVRWGPVLAGLFSALATLLVLSLLGVAIGLTAAAGDPNGGTAAAATNNAGNYGVGTAIWAALSALISFFIGGFVAARTSAVRGTGNGWINGAMVWAVALPLLLWLAASGASGFLNAIGFNLGGFFNTVNPANPNSLANPANPASPVNPANPNNPINNGTVQNATEAARNGAWGALGALILGLIAAGLGGVAGHRRDDETDHNVTVTR